MELSDNYNTDSVNFDERLARIVLITHPKDQNMLMWSF